MICLWLKDLCVCVFARGQGGDKAREENRRGDDKMSLAGQMQKY